MRAAFCHDWIYRTHPDGWTKPEADQMFRDLLLEDGVRMLLAASLMEDVDNVLNAKE